MVAHRIIEAYSPDDAAAELEAVESRLRALEAEQHNLTLAACKGLVTDEMVQRNKDIEEQKRNLHNRRGVLMSQDAALTEDDIVEFLAHGFDRSDEGFIFGSFIHHAHVYGDCLVAVFSFRDEVGDLAEERIALEKNTNPEGFACYSAGVPGDYSREPHVIALPCGFGIVIPLAS
jgi:hypothetical protein